MHQFLLNYFKNIFNPFEYIFLGFSLDSQGFARENPGKSLGNPCKSKENQRKMYSNGLKIILSIIYSCFLKLLTILFYFNFGCHLGVTYAIHLLQYFDT